MMNTTCQIIPLRSEYQSSFESLVAEYLPGSEPETILFKHATGQGIILLAIRDEQVVGCAFGWPTVRPGEFMLDGITVSYVLWRNGIGSALLSVFEAEAAKREFSLVSLGSAEGFVERFYMKNGYRPTCYKIERDGAYVMVKKFRSTDEYEAYERPDGHGFVVMEKDIVQGGQR